MSDTPLILRHHACDQLDRCIQVGRWHFCRRCSVLYPLTMVFAACYWRGWWLPRSTDPYVLWILPAPMVLEWSAGMFGSTYRRGRQVAATAIGAVPSGIAVAVHVHEPFAARVAWPVTAYVVVGFAVAAWCYLRRHRDVDWEVGFEEREAERVAGLLDLLPELGHEIDESFDRTDERGVKVTK